MLTFADRKIPNSGCIRKAVESDAAGICAVMIKAIQGCIADHGGQPELITKWCQNKTAENARGWIQNENNLTIVAVNAKNEVKGVALLDHVTHRLRLCYVDPEFQGRGIGKYLLTSIEAWALEQSIPEINLQSTLTAVCFYQKQCFERDHEQFNREMGRYSIIMHKKLV